MPSGKLMIRPAAAFIGLRYLSAQRANQFAAFVAAASVIGVALGVAALIVVLSVMNGFENELRTRLLGMTGHARILPATEPQDWPAMLADVRRQAGVRAAAPYVEVEGMLASGGELSGAIITGIDPAAEDQLSGIEERMMSGSAHLLVPDGLGIILGRSLALGLGVGRGDPLRVMVPYRDAAGRIESRLREFTVVGIFEVGLKDHDSMRALVHIDDAAVIAGISQPFNGIHVTVDDVFAAPAIIRSWQQDWVRRGGSLAAVSDWTVDNASYFRAVRIERVMMTLLLSLIVAVAAFNIVATLVMVVTDKRPSVAILRTLGYSRRSVISIFALQGVLIGWAGVLAGIGLGVTLALNVATLAPRLERLFGFEFMPADVYYLTALPSELKLADVVAVGVIALLLTALATVYPATRAATVSPAEVLRYE